MMRLAVDRRGDTGGGFGISLGLHGALLLLLLMLMRMGAQGVDQIADELTEIAYIEAKYGEEVAEKVRLKTRPVAPPVETKREEPAPADKAVDDSKVESKPLLQSKTPPKLQSRPLIPKHKLAKALDAPELQARTPARPQPELKSASFLQSKRFADAAAPAAGLENLRNKQALSADVNAPSLQSKQPKASFNAETQSLVGRKSKLNLDEVDFAVDAGGGGGGRMALQLASGGVEGGNANLVGGSLEAGKEVYQGSVAALVPEGGFREERRAPAGADVELPTASGGGARTGRRTILDYGAGGGGGGGGALRGRKPAVAEAPAMAAIVEDRTRSSEQKSAPAEASASLGGNGVSMTMSGQIVGRDIVSAPKLEYPAAARRNGWEGAVAVHFTVMPDGRVKDNVYFEQTSAHRDLNRSAMAAIRQFVFAALAEGQPRTEQWGVITIVFRLS